MLVFPTAKAFAKPVVEFIEAIAGLLLLHTPPETPLLPYVFVTVKHRAAGPVIFPAFGTVAGFTVIVFELLALPVHDLTVYVIVAVPPERVVTTPVAAFTVATAVLLLLHVPPALPLVV